MKKIFQFLMLAACLYTSVVIAEVPKCDNLPVRDCWATKGCVLECDVTTNEKRCEPYHCRAAKNQCEALFAQKDIDKQKCESSPECTYEQPSCFCPGPMDCRCGGGPPARCRKK